MRVCDRCIEKKGAFILVSIKGPSKDKLRDWELCKDCADKLKEFLLEEYDKDGNKIREKN